MYECGPKIIENLKGDIAKIQCDADEFSSNDESVFLNAIHAIAPPAVSLVELTLKPELLQKLHECAIATSLHVVSMKAINQLERPE